MDVKTIEIRTTWLFVQRFIATKETWVCHITGPFVTIQLVKGKYRKISNTRRTKSQNLNDSRLFLRLSLPNPLNPCVKSRMKMYLEQLNYIWVINNFVAYWGATYIRDLTVMRKMSPWHDNTWQLYRGSRWCTSHCICPYSNFSSTCESYSLKLCKRPCMWTDGKICSSSESIKEI